MQAKGGWFGWVLTALLFAICAWVYVIAVRAKNKETALDAPMSVPVKPHPHRPAVAAPVAPVIKWKEVRVPYGKGKTLALLVPSDDKRVPPPKKDFPFGTIIAVFMGPSDEMEVSFDPVKGDDAITLGRVEHIGHYTAYLIPTTGYKTELHDTAFPGSWMAFFVPQPSGRGYLYVHLLTNQGGRDFWPDFEKLCRWVALHN